MNKTSKLSLLAMLLVTALVGCKDPDPVVIDPEVDITVTTYTPTEITATTAECGCHVTVTGEAQIAEMGVCWNTEGDPVATDNHLSTTATGEPFNCTLAELTPETEYHVRAYALYESEYYYGQDLSFTTLPDNGGGDTPTLPAGALGGLFSVSETQQVRFSQGNLQYQASTKTWRFAEKQTDYVGEGNANIGESYDGWIDLFGWGTSGYDHGANAYQPWSTSANYSDYYAYGGYSQSLSDQSGQADWGYNAISNGGNEENSGWRTMRSSELKYLLEQRVTASGIHFANACVDGTNGTLIFPDDWDGSVSINNADHSLTDFAANTIDASEWESLQAAGVVFLPAAGMRIDDAQTIYVQSGGVYWASNPSSSDMAYTMYFVYEGKNRAIDANYRNYGMSVRLVKDNL